MYLIVTDYVKRTFPEPIDQWALFEAQKSMEKYAIKKKGASVFPVEKIHKMLLKVCIIISAWLQIDYKIMNILKYALPLLKVSRLIEKFEFEKGSRDRNKK